MRLKIIGMTAAVFQSGQRKPLQQDVTVEETGITWRPDPGSYMKGPNKKAKQGHVSCGSVALTCLPELGEQKGWT